MAATSGMLVVDFAIYVTSDFSGFTILRVYRFILAYNWEWTPFNRSTEERGEACARIQEHSSSSVMPRVEVVFPVSS